MTATDIRERFPVGTRVHLTDEAVRAGISRGKPTGVVSGYTRYHWQISVLRDETARPSSYDAVWWERDESKEDGK